MRAEECVNDLDALIKRLNGNASAIDFPAKISDQVKKVGPYGIPEEIVRQCSASISAILSALGSKDRPIKARMSRRPPEWWGDIRALATGQRLKDATAEDALSDAINILDAHVHGDRPHIATIALLVGNLDHKIKASPSRGGFRAPGNPNPDSFTYVFEMEIHKDVNGAIKETFEKVVPMPKSCVSFLRAALEEVESFE